MILLAQPGVVFRDGIVKLSGKGGKSRKLEGLRAGKSGKAGKMDWVDFMNGTDRKSVLGLRATTGVVLWARRGVAVWRSCSDGSPRRRSGGSEIELLASSFIRVFVFRLLRQPVSGGE